MRLFSLHWTFFRSLKVLSAILLVCALSGTRAQTTWNVGDGSWNVTGNWTSGVPGVGENFFLNNSGTAQITAGIDGVGNIGTLGELAGESGTLSITGGSLSLSSALRIGEAGAGTVTISGASQVIATEVVLGGQVTGGGSLNLDGGILTTGQISKGAGSGIVGFNSGTLRVSASQADLLAGVATVGLGAGGGTIDTQAFEVVTSTVFDGVGGLTKAGAGRLTLTGTSVYTGATAVESGILWVDGNIASDVVVTAGATLGGDGIVGNITLEDGAILVPVGCFDGKSLTWHSGATIVYELGLEYGILELSENFGKAGVGPFEFTFLDDGWEVDQTYSILFFDTSTDFVESDFGYTNMGGFAGTFSLEAPAEGVAGALRFTLTAIPEPSTAALGLVGLIFAFVGSRRRVTVRPGALG